MKIKILISTALVFIVSLAACFTTVLADKTSSATHEYIPGKEMKTYVARAANKLQTQGICNVGSKRYMEVGVIKYNAKTGGYITDNSKGKEAISLDMTAELSYAYNSKYYYEHRATLEPYINSHFYIDAVQRYVDKK